MLTAIRCYREIWCVDFEFRATDGDRPEPLCVVAREFWSGRAGARVALGRSPRRPAVPDRPRRAVRRVLRKRRVGVPHRVELDDAGRFSTCTPSFETSPTATRSRTETDYWDCWHSLAWMRSMRPRRIPCAAGPSRWRVHWRGTRHSPRLLPDGRGRARPVVAANGPAPRPATGAPPRTLHDRRGADGVAWSTDRHRGP